MSKIQNPKSKIDKAPLVLAIDVGSSSIRTSLYTDGAERLDGSEVQLSYDMRLTPDGGTEIDPRKLLDCLSSALDRTLKKAGQKAGSIQGVGMCSLVGNVLGVDTKGQPTTPIYTWADTRPSKEAAELRAALDGEALRQRTGCPIHSSYLPARLLWLKRTMSKAFTQTAQWVSLGEWVHLRLFGEAGQSLSVASWGGLLNRFTLDWDAELLSFLDLDRSQLPPLVDNDTALRGLRASYAKRWPALRDVPWFPCIADGVAGNLGCGCVTEKDVAVQVGTSGAMRALVPGTPSEVPEGLWCYRVDRHTSLLGGALSEGGNVLAWLRDTLNVPDLKSLEHEAAKMKPDSHGLTMLPFLAGERSPNWDAGARGLIAGLSLNTKPAGLMRAAQEAIAYRFGLVHDLLKPALPPARRIVASGGALLNAEGWLGILADVLGQPVIASAEPEASSRGAALMTLQALGLCDPQDLPARLGSIHKPNMKRHTIYRRAMQRQGTFEGWNVRTFESYEPSNLHSC